MAAPPKTRSLSCPNCGAALEIRGMTHTVSVVCVQCLSIVDAKDPGLSILQQFTAKERVQPLIPLGARGQLHGAPYEVIGFQERSIEVEGERYAWREYVLFNPFKGFRYLTEYDGHWNDVITVRAVPTVSGQQVRYLGTVYKHFQSAKATTDYVMGEFPWAVRVGEKVDVNDYVAPPRMLSSEVTDGEITWSLGEYMTGERVWETFKLPGRAPAAKGIYANQPSPYAGRIASVWKRYLLLAAALFLVMSGFSIIARREEVFRHSYAISQSQVEAYSFVTDVFELKGRTSTVEVKINTDLQNEWAYFNLALINEDTGQAWDFGREVSYYVDSEGSEGSRTDSALVPSVPPGRYYLRVEPETDPALLRARPGIDRAIHYEISVRRDVPSWAIFWIALALLSIPPILTTIRSRSYETRRWQESDHAPSSSDEEDD